MRLAEGSTPDSGGQDLAASGSWAMSRESGTIDPEGLSRPERALHRLQSRSLAARVIARGGCWCCARRDPRTEGWGRALCGRVSKPQFLAEGCAFEPDPERMKEVEGGPKR